jgi:predicted nucleotidyltransferase
MEQSGSFGSRLRALRKEAGLSASKLAATVGVTENAIRKIEAGSSMEPRFVTGIRMAKALGISPLLLVGDMANAQGTPDLAFVIRSIRSIRHAIEEEGIEHVDVFGSVARGDATPSSDVDLIFTPRPESTFSLFNLNGAANRIEDILGRKVDVITRYTAENSKRLRGAIEDAVRVF